MIILLKRIFQILSYKNGQNEMISTIYFMSENALKLILLLSRFYYLLAYIYK